MKNPFIPQPSYPTHQQPPLPPGPPPPQPAAQPDYSAYWAAQQPGAAQPTFNPQWNGPNPQWPGVQAAQVAAAPKSAADQSPALYANYGYGGQQNAHWQHQHAQQHQQHHYAQPPAPVVAAAPPQPYNPYQPQAAVTYSQPPQPYVPQGLAPPQTPAQQPYRPLQPPQAPQQFFQQPPQQPRAPTHMQHASPQQHPPPAKRPRFDNSHQVTPQQPRFQQNAAPMSMQGVPLGPSKPSGMAGLPSQPSQMQSQNNFSGGMARGGMGGGRGGVGMNRGGRGGNMGGNGGNRGMGMNRGRGGSMHGGSGGRGGPGHSAGGAMRGHQSRDRGGFNNANRRGGNSFNNASHHHNNASFRGGHGGRGGGNSMHGSHGRSGRSDGFHQNRAFSHTTHSTSGSGIGKRDENRRTLTDFKIVGLEIRTLNWQWGQIPTESESEPIKKEEEDVKVEEQTQDTTHPLGDAEEEKESPDDSEKPSAKEPSLARTASNGATAARMRIYFHTPPSADDSRPIVPTPSASDLRKGKRKKLDDDDGDAEDGQRAPPPPPHPKGNESVDGTSADAAPSAESNEHDASMGRGSVAPSVAETASEADWLMAAIADGDADAEGEMEVYEQTQVEGDIQVHDDDGDGEYEDDEPMTESHVQQDEAETQTQTQTQTVVGTQVEFVPNGDSTVGEVPTQSDTSATPVAGVSSSEAQDVKVEESKPPVSQTAEQSALPGIESEGKDDVTATGTAPQADEPDLELIISSINSPDEPGHDEAKAPQSDVSSTVKEEPIQETSDVPEKPVAMDVEHLPEPPASPTSNTAFSGTSASTSNVNHDLPLKPPASGTKVASANRVSIAYAAGTRRLLIDAEVVEKMTIFRAEGRIDIDVTVEKLGAEEGFKGISIETLNDSKAYVPIAELSEASESDPTLPPFWKSEAGSKALVSVHLDKDRPLSEPRWVKTGDVHDWLKEMFGGRFWVAGEAVGWEKKIDVRYPDPAPTIQTVLTGWSANSPVGVQSERSRFLKTHMIYADNVLEILLRLVRGERATPFSQANSAISAPSVQGPLLAAMDSSSPHAAQQTHVSLAVIAFVRLAEQYAEQALGEGKGKEQADDRVGEIIRSLPSHLLYKSLDGMFKEWRADKKGGR